MFKLVVGRLPDGPDLASQPSLSRFENAVTIPDLWRLRDALVDLFVDSFDEPPGCGDQSSRRRESENRDKDG